ncbi:hypothetical protein SAMN05660420_01228 [Desulfuromusa kysingii]|uniref:Polysaccharide pyruvyl transferase n=1 Tax=Desulfuromusa kysingii TaxID=37625 RepID=A0A1H3YI68_9BACT|nr:hypothetical protein [Desulfuromusa kysingii]SEA10582.1 hypothetical protein SAMN05660420_01228 [Desulfuromusa kysingii]
MKFLKKIIDAFKNTGKPLYPVENGITFIHHNPDRGNIGDYLCSPRHYFKFHNPIKDLHIIGGGVFVGLAIDKIRRNNISFEKSVLWGAGQSLRNFNQQTKSIDDLPYLDWAIRDKKYVLSEKNFVPCCSCLHQMLETPVSTHKTLLFLNADPKVTSSATIDFCNQIAMSKGWEILFNNCTETDIVNSLKYCDHIVTNSYHGSYWGLLSGRKVTMMGYSSKFISLLDLFNFSDKNLIQISRGEASTLIEALEEINDETKAIQLANSVGYLKTFRNLNISFADRLIAHQAFSDYTFTDRVTPDLLE